MAGTISLRIDRDPDFFALLRMRGESIVFVAVRGREVIGCISAALRTAYISGVPETVAYVGDMKVHPRFSGTRIALRLIQALEAYLRSAGIDLCFSVVADGNQRAMPLFEGRLGMPRWVPLGRFLVDGLVPSPFKGRSERYSIEMAESADLPAIAKLLDRFHSSRQFAPRLAERRDRPRCFPIELRTRSPGRLWLAADRTSWRPSHFAMSRPRNATCCSTPLPCYEAPWHCSASPPRRFPVSAFPA